MLVDDGVATGATIEAAALSLKKQNAAKIIIAAPVASSGAVERLQRIADDVKVLLVDPDFDAVGRYYESFSQTTDEEVLNVLRSLQAQ
jgi:predicted phosphoribosyltransferase